MFRSVLQPDHLELLTRVLDEYCAVNAIHVPEDRDQIASSLLAMYQSGITDEQELAARINRPSSMD